MKQKKRLLLVDGDIIVFQCLAACMFDVLIAPANSCEFYQKALNFNEAAAAAINTIEAYRKELQADKVIFCYTDSEGDNFRKSVYPEYKSNRNKLLDKRPMGLSPLKEYLAKAYESEQWDSLEADDVMGILATDPDYRPDWEKIIVSEDKDLKTIPCLLYNPRQDAEAQQITEEAANEFLAMQCLAGDAVDGYSGCPSIGLATAEKLLKTATVFTPYVHTFKSGVRKGAAEGRWQKEEGKADGYWETILSTYAKHELTEAVAIQNAQCARILRHCDYEAGKVRLWNPESMDV